MEGYERELVATQQLDLHGGEELLKQEVFERTDAPDPRGTVELGAESLKQ